jgi:hypothetical protein
MISGNYGRSSIRRSWHPAGNSGQRLLVLTGFLLLWTSSAVAQDTVWSKLYLRDLDSLRAAIAANHPGTLDEQNPEFARILERAYAEASRLAPRIADFASFRIGLTRFINQFQDEHLQIGFTRGVDSLREAGIITSYRAGGFYVVDVHQRYADAAQLMGARIVSCDGQPARAHFSDRVLWWRGRPNIEADWYRQAPLFFVDYGPPTPAAPTSCIFSARGREVTRTLEWRITPAAAFNAVLQRANPAPQRQLGTERVDGKVLWVRLPTFSANAEPVLGQMRATLDSLRTFVASNPSWNAIVFDLRGNSGGSSTWGDEIAKIVFGPEWQQQAVAYLYDGVYTEWRLSEDNIKSMRGIQDQIARRDGADSPGAVGFRQFVDSAEAQFKRGIEYYGTRQTRSGAPAPSSTSIPGKVIVITTPSCFSACLDFLDRMRLHPAVVQVGTTTGVDTNYMENWGGPISGLTRWGHPLKVYRNRRRGNNESYRPHVAYEGSLEDDTALRTWVTKNFINR